MSKIEKIIFETIAIVITPFWIALSAVYSFFIGRHVAEALRQIEQGEKEESLRQSWTSKN